MGSKLNEDIVLIVMIGIGIAVIIYEIIKLLE
jgi:hypothetical protein